MLSFRTALFVFLGISSVCVLAWPGKKDDDEPKMPKGKEAAELGIAELGRLMQDPRMMADLMADMNDPEIMAGVEEMMKDKKFQKEIKKMVDDDTFKDAMKQAANIMNDPETMMDIKRMTEMYENGMASSRRTSGDLHPPSNSVEEVMKLMGDPKMASKVEQMMRDPEFQKQMKTMMNDPAFNNAVREAAREVEAMVGDPSKRQQLEKHARILADWQH